MTPSSSCDGLRDIVSRSPVERKRVRDHARSDAQFVKQRRSQFRESVHVPQFPHEENANLARLTDRKRNLFDIRIGSSYNDDDA